MIVGVFAIELRLPMAESLKDRRQVVRRLKDRLRGRFNISVAEDPAHADKWQRAALAVAALGHDRNVLERLFDSILDEAEGLVPGDVLEVGADFLPLESLGATSWADAAAAGHAPGDDGADRDDDEIED